MAPILVIFNAYHLTLARTISPWTRKNKKRRSNGLGRFPNYSFETKIPGRTPI